MAGREGKSIHQNKNGGTKAGTFGTKIRKYGYQYEHDKTLLGVKGGSGLIVNAGKYESSNHLYTCPSLK